MDDEVIANFAQGLRGPVIGRNHPEYEEARKLYNAMIDKRPLLIARCADVADVIAAVNFGRDNKLPIAIRGGGHNGPGLGSVDDGLVIDLSTMKGVRVDPKQDGASGPGCTTGDVDHATHAFGQAVPFGIVSTTGVAGLTLSGGHGYLSRQYGLAVDSLIEADVVLADGSFVTASETENADLLWALRGGGGNFGVVTSFLFHTHPAGMIYGGPIIFDLADAAAVMRWYPGVPAKARRTNSTSSSDCRSVPPGDPFPKEHWARRCACCSSRTTGRSADGEKAVNAVRAALPKPIIDWAGPMPYPALQSLFDALYPKGLQWYWKGDFVKTLPDAAIDAHLAHAAKLPSALSVMHLYPIDGAVHRQKQDAAAWGYRDATWSMVIVGVDPDPTKAPALKQWAQDYWAAVHPFNLPGAYANFMMDDEGEARVKAAYGDNYDRLASLKKKYDPANLFHVNQNIRPAA